MEYTDLIKERFSVRKFTGQPVEDEKLSIILDSQNYAPTAVNMQAQKVYVANSPEAISKLRLVTRTTFGASTALIVGYDERIAVRHPLTGQETGPVNSATVATYMILEAWNQGVGSCWYETFSQDDMRRLFGMPSWFVPMHVILLGYPTEDCVPLARWHNAYRPMDEIVTYL